MHNDFERSKVCNAIALHYFDEGTVDAKSFFYFVENWMQRHGMAPTKMGGKGDKNITFSRGKKALEKSNFSGIKEQGISILALPLEEKIATESFDFIMSGSIDYDGWCNENCVTLCWDNKLVTWQGDYIKSLVKDICKFCKPQYGYAFQREFKKGPVFHPLGIGTGSNVSWEEGYEIARWRTVGLNAQHSQYKPYMVRDVYRLNFLSQQHLDGSIGSQTLQNWIQADKKHGTLEQLLPKLWCWSVLEDNIEAIKRSLIPHKLLIAHLDI